MTSGMPTASLSHRTEHAVLVTAGITDTDVHAALHKHDQELQIHVGGTDGKAPSTTRRVARIGHDCWISGMKYPTYRERRGQEACRDIPLLCTP